MNKSSVCAEILRIILSHIYLSSGKFSSRTELGHVHPGPLDMEWPCSCCLYFSQLLLIRLLIYYHKNNIIIYDFLIRHYLNFVAFVCPCRGEGLWNFIDNLSDTFALLYQSYRASRCSLFLLCAMIWWENK